VITTPQLIEVLASGAKPVKRLRPPLLRAAFWLVLAALVFGLLAVAHGARSDLAQQLARPEFALGLAASLITGALAAVAAFFLSLPDRSRAWGLLPVPTLILWISTVSYGCLTNWVDIGPDGMRMGEAARCFATLLVTSLPLSLGLFVMLRHAAWLRPTAVTLTGGLAVAAMAASALSLFHNIDATVMVLIWNFGVAGIVVGISYLLGHRASALA
jgi:hypothetical protein